MPTLASQTPFTALFCSALLCVGCCCINNTLRADQRERKREDNGGNNSRESNGEGDRGGAGEAWGKQSSREREREGWRNTVDQSDIQEDESEKKELQGGRERERRLRGLVE